ncbi:MAG: type IV pilus twitching motility protein PilT [Candidatus Eisenbacteria bacterium]|nr:type IV pilus twitching motility protein PilT [Candidatus Eisenbacteria bacterium]
MSVDLRRILEKMVQSGASDLHLKVGVPPCIRVNGDLIRLDDPPPSLQDARAILDELLKPHQKQIFEQQREVDFAFGVPGLARFRANFYQQRGTFALCFRQVPMTVPTLEELHLPPVLAELAKRPRGLILVTGATGSGKSTTLASMIHVMNREMGRTVITIEDPIEYLHSDQQCYISQREVGLDTESFGEGLKHILRQDPDVILVGEIRDVETMETVLSAADTGHLVFSTLHTTDAVQTVNRILSFFPPDQREEARYLVSSTLQAVVSQRLIPRADGKGRVPAAEVLVTTATVREYIEDPTKTSMIRQLIAEGVAEYGTQTFDQSVMQLYTSGLITIDQALVYCSNPNEFMLRVKGIHTTSDRSWDAFEAPEEGEEKTGMVKTRTEGPDLFL